MELIDKEAELELLKNNAPTIYAILGPLLATAPTVDAVEVVRCKDCKHLYNRIGYYRCSHYRGLGRISEDSFCCYGERSGKT